MYRLLQPCLNRWSLPLELLELSGRRQLARAPGHRGQIELGRGSATGRHGACAAVSAKHADAGHLTLRAAVEAVESVDLRHVDGYAIRLRGVSTVA
jgi:cell division protein FtsQ